MGDPALEDCLGRGHAPADDSCSSHGRQASTLLWLGRSWMRRFPPLRSFFHLKCRRGRPGRGAGWRDDSV